MRIPANAVIPPDKITNYLLVPKKSGDKSKYLLRAGFTLATAALLEAEIRRVTAGSDAIHDRVRQHGTYYNVFGSLIGPSGVALPVKLIWLHRLDDLFTFVTLVPQPGS